MKKILTVLAVALFLGACHCTKCTTTPNRSNTCVKSACTCKGPHKAGCKCPKCGKDGCAKKAERPLPPPPPPAPAPKPAPKPTPKVSDDAAISQVATVSQRANATVLSFKDPINFRTNSDQIEATSYPQIKQAAQVLKKYPNTKIRVEGYTDSLGDPAYNIDLSQRRAKAVALELVNNGVAAENVSFIGYGAKNPVATNKTAAGRAQNRRVELEVTNN